MTSSISTGRILKVSAWSSLASQIVIVVTGGAVRLTGSGLGCPTWPKCTEDSITTVPEMGIHGLIEFTNRLLTFALLVIAAVTLWFAFKSSIKKLRFTSVLLILGIILQAVVGGITVLVKLNPWIVGLHFVISALMIVIASHQLWVVYSPRISTSTNIERVLSNTLVFTGTLAILFGVLVTGSGPHAGDLHTERNGLDSELWQHVHSWPAYFSMAIALFLVWSVRKRDVDGYASRLVFWTVVTMFLQAIVGVAQSRLGLPIFLVLIHLSLASVLVALLALQRLALKRV